MNRTIGVPLSAFGLLAAGAIGAGLVGSGIADGAPTATRTAKPATFQMYANVDAAGDLGSHHDAEKVELENPSDPFYAVIFSKPVGHCAADAQVGNANGKGKTVSATSRVISAGGNGSKVFVVGFTDANGNAVTDPFMVTVTCRS